MQILASIAPEVTATPSTSVETRPPKSEARLQDLVPIVMVIVGGCETCR